MNCQTATPRHTQHLIAAPVRRSLPAKGPQASRPCWDAYPYPDEESSGDPAGALTLSHPELFCLLTVAPDELQAIVDGFLS
jgi:hypothetical protein